MNPKQAKEIRSLLSKPKNIVIVTHWSPDGDAIGSSLGLYNYLLLKKHKVTVVVPNDYPTFLSWMAGEKKIINYSQKPTAGQRAVAKADLIFCLDFNTLSRIEELGKIVEGAAAKKMIIDHHLQPDSFANFLLHTTHTSSTCELVYDFIVLMNDRKLINPKIADCLYTGIMTDTGSFRYPSTSAATHRVVAALMDAGAAGSEIHNRVYDDNDEDKLRLLGYCLSEKLRVFPEFRTAYFALSEEELRRFHYKKGDTEGVVNYALSLRGIRFAAFLVERDGMVKTSFRSKGSFDVNQFARKHFNGGGHANAAGGASKDPLPETVRRFEALLPEYKTQLNARK